MTDRPGYSTVNAYLICDDADAAITYYCRHLGAQERYRLTGTEDKVMHAELQIGGSVVMISDAFPQQGICAPGDAVPSPVGLAIYVDDCDTVFEAMVEDGSTSLFPVADQFHGDRQGKLRDPFGHIWFIATNHTPLSPDEIVTAAKRAFS